MAKNGTQCIQEERAKNGSQGTQEERAKNGSQATQVERGVVYIKNIPYGFHENQMFKYCSQFGTVTKVRLGRSKKTGSFKGYGFVEFQDTDVTKIVAEAMNNLQMHKKFIKAKVVPKKKMRPTIFKHRADLEKPLLKKARQMTDKKQKKMRKAAGGTKGGDGAQGRKGKTKSTKAKNGQKGQNMKGMDRDASNDNEKGTSERSEVGPEALMVIDAGKVAEAPEDVPVPQDGPELNQNNVEQNKFGGLLTENWEHVFTFLRDCGTANLLNLRAVCSQFMYWVDEKAEFWKHQSLLRAVRAGDLDKCRKIVDKAEDKNPVGPNGQTALQEAASLGYDKICQLIVDEAAEKEPWDQVTGASPLHLAAKDGHLDVARVLIESATNPSPLDWDGLTPLHHAAMSGHRQIAELLLEKGSDLSPRDLSNRTPLHYAAEGNHFKVVELLLEKGADKRLRDQDGKTPVVLAEQHGNWEVAKLIERECFLLNNQ